MILVVDIGNTNIVTGCVDEKDILFRERMSTNHRATVLEYVTVFRTAFELYGIDTKKIDGAIISSVVPALTNVIKDAVEKLCSVSAMIVGPGIKTGVSIVIDNPAQLGSDLITGAVASVSQYSVPQIVIDMGTATTISVINIAYHILSAPSTMGKIIIISPLITAPLANDTIMDIFGFIIA